MYMWMPKLYHSI